MIKTKEIETKNMNLKIDLALELAQAEGNLKFLAQELCQDWKGSMTQGEAILHALKQVQNARKFLQEISK